MPKTKRFQKISLTQTKKKGLSGKQQLVEDIRSCVEKYSHLYLFSVQNMRNNKLKFIRNEWKDSRFFLGKNRVIAIALGRSKESECRENLHEISKRLKGQCGIVFTDKTKEEVIKYFEKHVESDYARSGNIATETVTLQPGPLEQFPFNMEPYLRQLGLPTSLQRGVVTLLKEHTVCKEGNVLTPEEARLLKLLCIHMAEFKVTIEAVWQKDGTFEEIGHGGLLMAQDDANETESENEDME
ncbi:mRNA turnover protein 4 homolog [Daphnia carinata]|uniref:mRNA turnover protein 4 homolog n=1 Tax=Daphnia carinata TaxID=120202 RepID=UPI00257DDE38|nr:mRNA turnover protein 4 homolog [Daphnia carinata]